MKKGHLIQVVSQSVIQHMCYITIMYCLQTSETSITQLMNRIHINAAKDIIFMVKQWLIYSLYAVNK